MAAQIRPGEQGGDRVEAIWLRVIDLAIISDLLYSCKHGALGLDWSHMHIGAHMKRKHITRNTHRLWNDQNDAVC